MLRDILSAAVLAVLHPQGTPKLYLFLYQPQLAGREMLSLQKIADST